jgi:hypothetical protein
MATSLMLHNAEITGIAPGIFGAERNEDHRHLRKLHHVTANYITSLYPSTFNGLYNLLSLDISSNNLTAIDTGAFLGLGSLQTMVLRNNRYLTTLKDGALEGLNQLRIIFLDECKRLSKIEAGVFGDTPHLRYVWMPDRNCSSRVVPWLPTSAACVEEFCPADRSYITLVGDGACDALYCPLCDTPGCMWDGGDCLA